MKSIKKPVNRKEQAFRFATVIFMVVAFACVIASLIFFEDDEMYIGILLLGFGLGMLGVTFWSYFSPFYPVLLGLTLFASLIALLFYSYPEVMLHGMGKSFHRYIILALGVIIYALIMGYKEWRPKKNLPQPTDGDY